MPQFAYLLIQKTTHVTYKILWIELSDHLADTTSVKALLDHASVILLNPIAEWDTQSLYDVWGELGTVDKEFLERRALFLPQNYGLFHLHPDFCQLQVVISFNEIGKCDGSYCCYGSHMMLMAITAPMSDRENPGLEDIVTIDLRRRKDCITNICHLINLLALLHPLASLVQPPTSH
ncbi:hypothetical protein M404DRAFT_8928 [Pisolithus tinctorius Marx 270]|uniref:Uncharacterized protein n=1 Tax=Pisolithus tinctorius Marx 270 TaxID=870435 RepID=A0A0C3K806_PISTI|nr:hypothetical protein M404DRAFT_8928 [Pisolithus tinctorius Marx 270]